jgi:multidrug resistance efflux pump
MRKAIFVVVPLAAFLFAVFHVVRAQQTPPAPPPPVEPARAAFGANVAGAGLVEPQTENIAIGSQIPGVVREVHVKVGQKVKQGDVLFQLDDRHLQAELKTRDANLRASRSKLYRLMQMPRPEEIPPAEAKVREAEANLANEEDLLQRARVLHQQRALSVEELVKRQQAAQMAKEQLARVMAELRLLKAGAWEPEKDIARAEIAQMEAALEQTKTEIERLRITAPMDGEVLQVNLRPGEFVAAAPSLALVILGNVQLLHLRVDFDEHDIFRIDPARAAFAHVRGQPSQKYPLRFVRVEPFVVPKKSLTGVSSERVDTRVLQVIFAIDAGSDRLYVGQQMDVFLEAKR